MAILNSSSQRKLATFILSISLLSVPGLANSATFKTQSTTKAAEWGFDFVEEFDGLQDWKRNGAREGNQYNTNATGLSRMPKLANGENSAWGYYSEWSSTPPAAPWIGSETTSGRKIWRGTKSLAIDLGDTNYGPSRLGIHMDGGYKDFSLFYMVWIPKNMFPTSCVGGCSGGGGLGTYTPGQSYTYYAAWKLNTFNMNCNSAQCPGPYGDHYTIPLIKQYNYTPKGLQINNSNYGPENAYALDGGISLDQFMGEWWGIEFRIRNTAGDTAYLMDIWAYDKQGKSTQVMKEKRFPIVAGAQGGVWDQFFFGGNNSNSWSWGPTMQSHYYIDDLIIDNGSKGRIGPRYFSKIGNSATAAPPSPPANTGGVQTQ